MTTLVTLDGAPIVLSKETTESVIRRDVHGRIAPKIELAYDIERPATSCKTSSTDLLAAFADVVKHRSLTLVSEYMRKFAMANMKLIMTVFNDEVDVFCRKFCKTPQDVLKILLDVGDDGTYDWIPGSLLLELFCVMRDTNEDKDYDDVTFKTPLGMKRKQVLGALSPQFVKYLYTEAPIGFCRKRALGRDEPLAFTMVSLLPPWKRARGGLGGLPW